MFGIVDPPKQGSLRFQVYDTSKSQPDERRNCHAPNTTRGPNWGSVGDRAAQSRTEP